MCISLQDNYNHKQQALKITKTHSTPRRRKVVAIGGGTGLYQVLVGLKKYPVDLAAIVTMADSGGSAGRLRKEFGMLPPGDVRRALLALSNLPISQKTLETLFSFRFEKGDQLRGHSFGNLFLAALTQITGREDLAIKEAGKILDVSGLVCPVTMDKSNLVATLESGKLIFGESNIDLRWQGKHDAKIPIKKVFLSPAAEIAPEAKRAIESANTIVIGPGDLYTSLIPNLIVGGVPETIERSKAKIIIVVNLMTKPGETDNFTSSRFIDEIFSYLGNAYKKVGTILINSELKAPSKITQWYQKFKSVQMTDDLGNSYQNAKVIRTNMATGGTFLRHDPAKLARAIYKVVK